MKKIIIILLFLIIITTITLLCSNKKDDKSMTKLVVAEATLSYFRHIFLIFIFEIYFFIITI